MRTASIWRHRHAIALSLALLAIAAGELRGEAPRAPAGAGAPAASPETGPVAAPRSRTDAFEVLERRIEDLKAVFATVRSKDLVEARARTPGTVASLKVDEGAQVATGQLLAIIADDKIALRIRSLDAQIQGIESRLRTTQTELERSEELRKRGVSPQARVDQARTAFEVASNELKSAKAERSVLEEQIKEGQVLAPAEGRVLRVPFTAGSVVTSGESVATIAANELLLRIELPERHARFTRLGDTIRVGGRGLGPDDSATTEGRIIQVYPELKNGKVVADAEVAGLGGYFVGERALVWIAAGYRSAFVIPRSFTRRRHGQDFVQLKSGGRAVEVVVQLGRNAALPGHDDGVEVLSGVTAADILVRP